ncbi:MAG: hypothetical protein ACRENI_06415 [Gemmatimonadaceae bacterium]
MTKLTAIKLTVAAVGLGVWFYGLQTDDSTMRWVGVGLLAAAVLLRFIKDPERKSREGGSDG